jgi:hypothetical protein
VELPFEEDYDADLESKVADIVQCALEGKGDPHPRDTLPGALCAKDIPGRTWTSPPQRAAADLRTSTDVTGFGVRFALELLLQQDLAAALRGAA